mmetsp:Transcript_68442/g.189551  ORF Transcript_68442/g.189551 Transcript_68442/m.189551 type:complete len:307 (+) Transcript_68442:2-922(+)
MLSRCPYDNVPIPPIVVCGVMGTSEYVYHEKFDAAQRTGGIPCVASDCPGVALRDGVEPRPTHERQADQMVRREEISAPFPVACRLCGTRMCGRRICGNPWSLGHRCWDMLEADRLEAERRAERDLELSTVHRSLEVQDTRRRLAAGPRIRPCPRCGTMVEHIGGCNMVYHDSCGLRWCFVCRRMGTSCSDFVCRTNADTLARSGHSTPVQTPRTPIAPVHARVQLHRAARAAASCGRSRVKSAALAALVIGLVVYYVDFLHRAVRLPRAGFLGSGLPASETCGTSACDPATAAQAMIPKRPHLDA